MKLHILTLTVLACGFSALAADPNPDNLYGVVELGSSGIKSMVVENFPDSKDTSVPPVEVIKQYEPQDKNPYDGDALDRVTKAVNEVHELMRKDYKLRDDRFYIVGSSGLPAAVRNALSTKALMEGTSVEYITAAEEAELVFRGIVPKNRLNLNEVVVLDIGSGNSKGAYLVKNKPTLEFENFDVALGTKTFALEVTKAKKDGSMFMVAADPLRKELLLPKVQSQVRQLPGMQNCSRVYLAGGICWAMTTLLHPETVAAEANKAWVKLTPQEVANFYERATTDPAALLRPDLGGLTPEAREKAEKEIARITKAFNHDQLMSGACILKTYMDEMNFHSKAAVFFAKKALFAWPQGYIVKKIDQMQTGK